MTNATIVTQGPVRGYDWYRNHTGLGRIAGRTYVLAVPAPFRTVRLHLRANGVQVASVVSDAAGDYEFKDLATAHEYFVTAFDVDTGYNAVIQDRVTPTPYLGAYVPPPVVPFVPGAGNYTPAGTLAFNLVGAYTTPAPLVLNLV